MPTTKTTTHIQNEHKQTKTHTTIKQVKLTAKCTAEASITLGQMQSVSKENET
jgi:hypothetical protein